MNLDGIGMQNIMCLVYVAGLSNHYNSACLLTFVFKIYVKYGSNDETYSQKSPTSEVFDTPLPSAVKHAIV